MRKKTIKIPIYRGKLTMILAKDLSYIEKNYTEVSLDNYGAVFLINKSQHKHYIVAFTDSGDLGLVAHEIVHLKNEIFKDCGVKPDLINDEAEAYLTGYLFDEIYKFLNKK